MRTLSREAVFKFLYSKLFNPSDEGLFDVLISDLDENDKKFAKDLLSFVIDNYDNYLDKLSNITVNFKLNRIHNADKCAILIGMAELDNYPDTPIPVAIDEAVKISKKYSTDKSPDFVNGILSAFTKEKNNG